MPKKRKGHKHPAKRPTPFSKLTENGAPSYESTGNARVNFFFKSVRGLADAPDQLHQMLHQSWQEDPLDTLKLIFQTRDCRGGKGEKAIFRGAIQWLAAHHGDVLAVNIQHIPTFGTWKDLLSLINTPLEALALDFFAEQLRKDLAIAEASAATEKKAPISLAVKWAPSEDSKDDKVNKAAAKIVKRLFKKGKAHMRDYRKMYLAPLRAYLKIPEVYMASNRWSSIEYNQVPSRCMNLHRSAFQKHDETRFKKFLEDVKSGKTTIKGKQMFPHELAKHYFSNVTVDDVVELQWQTIIDEVKKNGALKDSIVLSDVSGSMSGTPMEVSVALGLLISEVTEEPFRNLVISFEENPHFCHVKGNNLMERVKSLRAAPWGGSTNFSAVFDMILQKAKDNNLPQEAMPKRLFVISDMQFNVAGGGAYMTNHEYLKKKYETAGYQVPQIIYWNVRADTPDFPVSESESGVALVAGFSPSILKNLVENGTFQDPFSFMKSVIDGERYKVLTLGGETKIEEADQLEHK